MRVVNSVGPPEPLRAAATLLQGFASLRDIARHDWRAAAADMGLFITWFRYVPADGGSVLVGPDARPGSG